MLSQIYLNSSYGAGEKKNETCGPNSEDFQTVLFTAMFKAAKGEHILIS
jgi:hypothetical protein